MLITCLSNAVEEIWRYKYTEWQQINNRTLFVCKLFSGNDNTKEYIVKNRKTPPLT